MSFIDSLLTGETELTTSTESYLLDNTVECPHCGHWYSEKDIDPYNLGECPECGARISQKTLLPLIQEEFKVYERTDWN